MSLAFVREIPRWPVNSPHKWPVTWKMFPFDDVIMTRFDLQHWYLFRVIWRKWSYLKKWFQRGDEDKSVNYASCALMLHVALSASDLTMHCDIMLQSYYNMNRLILIHYKAEFGKWHSQSSKTLHCRKSLHCFADHEQSNTFWHHNDFNGINFTQNMNVNIHV